MKNRTLITAVIAMIAIYAVMLTPLSPMFQSVQAQTKKAAVVKPGTPEYYNDDTRRDKAKNAKYPIKDRNQRVGGNPQVDRKKGEDVSDPLTDQEDPNDNEEDVLVTDVLKESRKKTLQIETLDRDNNLWVLDTPTTDIYGEPVVVRRKVNTKKIVMIINCGNWAREVGPDYPVVKPTPEVIDNTCKDHNPNPTPTENRENGKLVSKTYNFGCGNVVTVPVETTPAECPECKSGSETEIYKRIGDRTYADWESSLVSVNELKKAKGFTLAEVISEIEAGVVRKFGKQAGLDLLAQLEAQKAGIGKLLLKSLRIAIDPCELSKGKYKLVFDAVSGDKKVNWLSKFKWFFIVALGIVAAVIIIKSTHQSTKQLIKPIPTPTRTPPPD